MKRKLTTVLVLAIGFGAACALIQLSALAHCDTMNGPLVPEAQAALEAGDIQPILKWIRKADEPEIKAAFAKAVAVRAKGAEARELADQYFLETLVRIHRAGEGAPFTGLKDTPPEPIVNMADKALAGGSPDGLIKAMNDHMAKSIREKFSRVAEANKHKDESVEAGRAFVKAYVEYTHYVEGIHTAIASEGGHDHEATGVREVPAKPHDHSAE